MASAPVFPLQPNNSQDGKSSSLPNVENVNAWMKAMTLKCSSSDGPECGSPRRSVSSEDYHELRNSENPRPSDPRSSEQSRHSNPIPRLVENAEAIPHRNNPITNDQPNRPRANVDRDSPEDERPSLVQAWSRKVPASHPSNRSDASPPNYISNSVAHNYDHQSPSLVREQQNLQQHQNREQQLNLQQQQ